MATHAQRPPDHGPGFVAISLCGLHVSRRKLSDTPTCKRCRDLAHADATWGLKPRKRPRVRCSICSQLVATTPNGKVWRHGVKPCRGSGQPVSP